MKGATQWKRNEEHECWRKNFSRASLLALTAIHQRFRNTVSTQIVMSISNGAATSQAVITQAET